MLDRDREEVFALQIDEGRDKVISLEKAIKDGIKPGMKVCVGGNPNAAITEVIRQFWDTEPGFVLIGAFTIDRCIDMVYANLLKKLITSSCHEYAPVAGPSRVIQQAYKAKKVEIESWSLFSIIQRLVAGAMRLDFMPVKSILGSSMAAENDDSFREINDPFGSGGRIGLVRALNPDISIIHGLAADKSGNTILAPDLFATGAAEWGALAATGGVIVTVEKIVSTAFIREHSNLVKIPSYLVNSVSEVPLGAHPQGLGNYGVREIGGYGIDNDFAIAHRAASDNGNLGEWIKQWILDCSSRQEYLRKLGEEKIVLLKGKTDRDVWKYSLLSMTQQAAITGEYNPKALMIVAAAKKIKEKVYKHGYKVIIAGSGVSALPAWLAYYQMRAEGHDVELLQGCGLFGYAPRPMDPGITNPSNLPTCKMITDSLHIYGVFANNSCLSVLGAGQIDKHGNINSTMTPDGGYLVGSGGANDAANAKEVLVVIPQSKKRFVDKLPYVTCCGDRVTTVISSMGIFEKIGNEKEFTLTGYYHSTALGVEARIKDVENNCGWDLKISAEAEEIPLPNDSDLELLQLFDPGGLYIK